MFQMKNAQDSKVYFGLHLYPVSRVSVRKRPLFCGVLEGASLLCANLYSQARVRRATYSGHRRKQLCCFLHGSVLEAHQTSAYQTAQPFVSRCCDHFVQKIQKKESN